MTEEPDVDDVLALALAAGHAQSKAAEQGNCSSRTVRRRLADPVFQNRVRQFRQALVAESYGTLCSLSKKAAETSAT